jgi:DNA invertase Pin-like site-specific DNA recombinase
MQEKFDTTTAMGRFVMDIIQRIAQLESEQIGERVKVGMASKARNGKGHLGSGHPYGYVYERGSLIIVENEAETVRNIYAMRSGGSSLRKIADVLNASYIRPKVGARWNFQSISNILSNPLYVGYLRWDNILRPGEHEAIVGLDIFEALNGPLPNE